MLLFPITLLIFTSIVYSKEKPPIKRSWAISLKFNNAEAIQDFSQRHNFKHLGSIGIFDDKEYHHFEDAPVPLIKKRSVNEIHENLSNDDQVEFFEIQKPLRRSSRKLEEYIPDNLGDGETRIQKRHFPPGFNDKDFPKQWHLFNDGLNGEIKGNDINVIPVWEKGINGSGVVISVIDDGIDFQHEDLASQWIKEASYDFTLDKPEPFPNNELETHGTRCAGEIAGVANNKVCGVGVAFGAKLAGIRFNSDQVVDATEARTLGLKNQISHIYSSSWGPADDGKTVDGPGTLGKLAIKQGIDIGRGGLGSIYVFASGNGGRDGDNCNFDGFANSIYTIAIGAISHSDKSPYYSEECSAHLAVTYSGGDGRAIVTTDVRQKCTEKHSGTSAAAPLASGMIALVLSVRPDLHWRDIQYLIIESAKSIDSKDESWQTNGVGKRISHKFGFGKMDASLLVENALKFQSLPIPQYVFSKKSFPATTIVFPTKHIKGLYDYIDILKSDVDPIGLHSLEHVQVTMTITHPLRGHLKIVLTSPMGTESTIAELRSLDDSTDGFKGWTFMTVRNWGEDPVGKWSLFVYDSRWGGINPYTNETYTPGILWQWELTLRGTCSSDHMNEINSNSTKGPHRSIRVCSQTLVNDRKQEERNKLLRLLLMLIVIVLFSIIVCLIFKRIRKNTIILQYRRMFTRDSADSYGAGDDDEAASPFQKDDVESPLARMFSYRRDDYSFMDKSPYNLADLGSPSKTQPHILLPMDTKKITEKIAKKDNLRSEVPVKNVAKEYPEGAGFIPSPAKVMALRRTNSNFSIAFDSDGSDVEVPNNRSKIADKK